VGGTQGKRQAREDKDGGGGRFKDMATSTILLCLANNPLREVLGLTGPVDI